MTKIEQLYNLIKSNPHIDYQALAKELDCGKGMVSSMLDRLKKQRLLAYERDDDGSFIVIANYREDTEAENLTYKGKIYKEIIDGLMLDFRNSLVLGDRMLVVREIRLLLEKI